MTVTDLIAVVNQISTSIKISWAVWLAWCLLQIQWYRRGRTIAPAPHRAPATPFRPDPHQVLPLRSWSDSPVWESASRAESAVTVTDVSRHMPLGEGTEAMPSEPRRRSRRSHQTSDEQIATECESPEFIAHD
jgi:hypothetical protein